MKEQNQRSHFLDSCSINWHIFDKQEHMVSVTIIMICHQKENE